MLEEEKSFVEIVKEMVKAGHSFEEAIENLRVAGLSRGDAEKLVEIVERKSEPEVGAALREMVHGKFERVQKAWELKKKRRVESRIRREVKEIKDIKFGISALLREGAPEKIPIFREKVNKYIEKLKEKEEARNEILGFLLGLREESILRRFKKDLRQAIEFFKEKP